MSRGYVLPIPPANGDEKAWHRWAADVVRILTLYINESQLPITDQSYAPSNVTTSRTFDADTCTVAELADVVGTMINDLNAIGKLRF